VSEPQREQLPSGDETRRQALLLIHERLVSEHGEPAPKSRMDPLDEVVFTILSQNTTDTNRDRAWAGLWREFDSWKNVAAAPVSRISKSIEAGGLHRTKAQRIKDLLEQLREERGDYEMDYLRQMDMHAARHELGRFKGLGAKSINCVLLFSLGQPAFPVDTHVHRILQRVGLVDTRDLSRANREVQADVPAEIAYPLHMNIIRHGREVCSARRPECWRCCIEDLCGFEEKRLESR
jgi:endonuclease-3